MSIAELQTYNRNIIYDLVSLEIKRPSVEFQYLGGIRERAIVSFTCLWIHRTA